MDKPNERHERFCREYVRRPVGNAAALAAGYSEDNAAAQACRLLARPDIQVRIAELRDEVAARQCGDVSAVLARLQVIYERVIEHNQFNTALRAVAMQLRVTGMVPEGRRGARRAGPDYGAMLSAVAGMADLAPEPEQQPRSAAEMPMNANKSQSFRVAARPSPRRQCTGMPIDANTIRVFHQPPRAGSARRLENAAMTTNVNG